MKCFAITATAVLLLFSFTITSPAGATSGSHTIDHTKGRTSTKKLGPGRKVVRMHLRHVARTHPRKKTSPPTTTGPTDASSKGGIETAQGSAPTHKPSSASSDGKGGNVETDRAPQPSPPTPPSPPTSPTTSTPPDTDSGSILWQDNFEGNWGGGTYVQSLPGRATLTASNPFEGSGAARFEVRPGDIEPDTGAERSEISGPTFNEGENFFVRAELRIPNGYSYQGSWQLINQLHESYWGGSPGMATLLDSNRRIDIQSGTGEYLYWRGPQLELERWYDVVYHVNLSRDPTEGYVEVWLDGVQQSLINGQTRMYGETIQAAQTYFKAGLYRCMGSSGVSLIEYDDIVIGTSLEAVSSV